MTILKDEIRKANKEHKCYFCGGMIKKGEKYRFQTVVQDDIYNNKAHQHCCFLASKLDMYQDDEGLTDDGFEEYVREDFFEYFSIEETSRLLFEKLKGDKEV